MKQIILLFAFVLPLISMAQYEGNTSPDYPTLIEIYKKLAKEHPEIELFTMGDSDYGLPIYLCVINGAQDSLATFTRARNSTTILINNAIHPGEPDGVNACLIWIDNWIASGKKTTGLPVIAIIPAYNVGGMMNRSGTSRANQNGPEEYGFRGNAQNLDLNRDFIKMDSRNMFTFAKIYQALDPDVFLDTHVSNGADYQYTMTYIASVKERMSPGLAALMHEHLIPYLEEESVRKGFDLIPYVDTKGETPETGIQVFNDLPRYAMGYASLMNAISFTLETHMLKPFPERVKASLVFIEATINWTGQHGAEVEAARKKAITGFKKGDHFLFDYQLADVKDSICFKGFEFSNPESLVTGQERLKYHDDRPFEKCVPYYKTYLPMDSVEIPDFFVVGAQCRNVIERLQANGVRLRVLNKDTIIRANTCKIVSFENGSRPYEGHFLHAKVERDYIRSEVKLKKGDVYISSAQPKRRFILSVLEPKAPDSYFAWNFFDSYVQQKEYFSPYVFEDKAKELLEKDSALKKAFEERKKVDSEFNESTWDQLYFIYQHSEYYEPTHNILPVYFGFKK